MVPSWPVTALGRDGAAATPTERHSALGVFLICARVLSFAVRACERAFAAVAASVEVSVVWPGRRFAVATSPSRLRILAAGRLPEGKTGTSGLGSAEIENAQRVKRNLIKAKLYQYVTADESLKNASRIRLSQLNLETFSDLGLELIACQLYSFDPSFQ